MIPKIENQLFAKHHFFCFCRFGHGVILLACCTTHTLLQPRRAGPARVGIIDNRADLSLGEWLTGARYATWGKKDNLVADIMLKKP